MINFLIVVILAYCAFLGIAAFALPGDDDAPKKKVVPSNTLPALWSRLNIIQGPWSRLPLLLLAQLLLLQALVVVAAVLLPPRLQAQLVREEDTWDFYQDK